MRFWWLMLGFVLLLPGVAHASPFSLAAYDEAVRQDAPAVYWRLGEQTGTVAADASGNARDATYASPAEQRTRTGVLGDDSAVTDSRGQFSGSYDLVTLASTAGLPAGPRTFEGWVQVNAPGARLFEYGPSVVVDERALVVGATRLATPRLTDARWHHLALTYDGTTLTSFVDGVQTDTKAGTLANAATTLRAARIANGTTVAYDELALYPSPLTAERVAAHFNASGNSRPSAPANVRADNAAVTWDASTAGVPQGQRAVDHYVVEAWQGGRLRVAQAVDGGRTTAALKGLAAGEYRFDVRAVNGFGTGPSTDLTATVDGGDTTYARTVTDADPELYWRLGETSGTLAADSSGHGHTGLINGAADQRTHTGGLANDDDPGLADGRGQFSGSYDLLRIPSAAGLPMQDRTVEAWVWSSNANGRILSYGDFSVEITERGLVVGGTPLTLDPDDDRRLTDSRWHHIAVTYSGNTITGYLDGLEFATAAKTLNTSTAADAVAARIAAGATIVYDDIAVYSRALDAGAIKAHFDASGNARPKAPTNVTVSGGGQALALYWDPPAPPTPPTGAAPTGQKYVDHYLLELSANGVVKEANAVVGEAGGLNLTGVPAGEYKISVRAINGFGDGEVASLDATMGEEEPTYVGEVNADDPALYWRLSEYESGLVADSSAHGHRAQYMSDSVARYRNGAMAHAPDGAKTDARGQFSGSYDLVRAPLAHGLPTGDRTAEAWVLSTNENARVINYGDFNVEVKERGLLVGGTALTLPPDDDRRLIDNRWHHIAVTYADGTITGYLDGHAFDSRPKTFNTVTTGELVAARIPAGATVAYDDIAMYPTALSAERIAAHFAASYNKLPDAPLGVQADTSEPNTASVFFYSTSPCCSSPWGQPFVDRYIAEAWQGEKLVSAQAVNLGRTDAAFTGLPAGTYTLRVRAVNGFGEGPDATVEATVTGGAATYLKTVQDDAPTLYWRLGEKSGTYAADSSGRGHLALYASPADQRTRAGALPADRDGALSDGRGQFSGSYDLIRAPLAHGLPTGDRTVEAWVWSSNDNARLIAYGDFSVEVRERGLVVGGTTLSLPADDDRRLTDSHWHHVVVSYADGTITGYLDGERFAQQPKSLTTVTTGELLAARIPAGATVVYDDLAVYARALDDATVAKHFEASGNARPLSPANVTAQPDTNALTVSWEAPNGSVPQGQRAIDHYVVEAWQGGRMRGAQAVDGDRRTATLSGLPAGTYEARVRAINGFATGPDGTAQATVAGANVTYAGAVTDAGPELYWRLGERSGTLLADASDHGHPANLASPASQRTKASGLISDPDSALGDSRGQFSGSYDLIRAPLAAGLPTADRTVEALVSATAPGGRVLVYGDFDVVVNERELTVAGTSLKLPEEDDRRLTDGKWHHLAVTYANHTLTAYLDGEPIAGAEKTLATTTTTDLVAARIAAGSTVTYDELAVYDKALDAETIAAHFALSGNPAPVDRRAPKPTIEQPADQATTTTRTTLSGRVGELPGDLPKVTVKVLRDGNTVFQRDVNAANGTWTATPTILPTGQLTLEVSQLDQAANIGKATRSFTVANQAPTAALALDKAGGTLPVTVNATGQAADADGDPLTYRLDWGDGAASSTLSGAHNYTRAGTFTVTLTVSDGTTTATQTKTVTTTLAEALKADAGDDQIAEQGKPVTFSAARSRPAVGIESYQWHFSDGTNKTGSTVSHTFDSPGPKTATLTIGAAGQSDTDSAAIDVREPAPAVIATVKSINGQLVRSADVLVILADGRRISATTGSDGKAELDGVPDGTHSFYAWAPNMRPDTATATVNAGAGSVTLTLTPGEIAGAGLTSHRMTHDEIVAAGINPNDPANSQVYSFTANIAIDGVPHTVSGAVSSAGLYGCGGSGAQQSCSGGGGTYVSGSMQGGVPLLQWLVIPTRTGFLKEFFDITMVVQNLASSEFTLKQGTASLELPAGLSFAPTSTPQQASVQLPDIPGQGDATTHWVVRGDSEGSYEPKARYTGTVDPIDLPIALEARLAEAIRVYGASAMQIAVDTDDRYDDRYPAHVRVGIKNTSPTTISNASLQIPVEGQQGYVAQPEQKREFSVASIGPGETWFPDVAGNPDDDFIIVPEPTGAVNLEESFISQAAGDTSKDRLSVTKHPQVQPPASAPTFEAKRRGEWLILKWQGRPGTGYQAYGAADRKSEFATLLDTMPAGATKALIRGASAKEVALSTVTPDRLVLHHPTAEVFNDTSSHPTLEITNPEAVCAADGGDLQVEAYDPDFDFSSIVVEGPGFTITKPVSGNDVKTTIAVGIHPASSTGTELVVKGKLAVGGEEPEDTITLSRRGDVNCDGLVHAAVMGDSYISGEGAYGYIHGTDDHTEGFSNICHRSPASWAPQLAATVAGSRLWDPEFTLNPPEGDWTAFLACSGAVTDNFWGEPNGGDHLPQALKLTDEQWKTVDIVFMSIGGNDAKFSSVITTCLLVDCSMDSIAHPIYSAIMGRWRDGKMNNLPQVGANVGAAEGNVRHLAPQAEVYQINYMDPFRPQPPTCAGLSLTVAASDWLDGHPIYAALLGAGLADLLDFAALADVLTIGLPERLWVQQHFLPELNANLAWAAGMNLGSDHLFDSVDSFAGHPICGDAPWVNGFVRGEEKLGLIGAESFHPNAAGHGALLAGTSAKWGATLGANPNETSAPKRHKAAARVVDPAVSITTELEGPAPGEGVLAPGGPGTVTVHDGPPNTELRVALEPLSTIVGTGRTDADGDAEIAIQVPAAAAPGVHLMTVSAGHEQLDVVPSLVTGTKACTQGADADGDGLADDCDSDPQDGPDADIDGDGTGNEADNCPLVANPAQTDSDNDYEGDACDPDQGAARSFRPAGRPVPAAPRSVSARVEGTRAIVTWEPPATGAAVTGYRITGGGQAVEAGPDARQATLDGLAPGSEVRIGVAALAGGAAGPIALSAAVRLPVAPVITPAVTPVPTPVGPAATPTPTPTAKPTISFRGAPKKITLSRKRTFVLRFKATPRLKGTYTLSGVKKKGTFKADAKGNVKLTIRTSARRSLKVKITAVSGAVRATHTFRLVVRRR